MSNRDDNRFDLDVRSILESGKEEVPSGIWDNLEPQLDIIVQERRKKVFLRRMRYVTATTTVAAAIAIALLFPWGGGISLPKDSAGQIAVVTDSQDRTTEDRLAMISETGMSEPHTAVRPTVTVAVPSQIPATSHETVSTSAQSEETGLPYTAEPLHKEEAKDRNDTAPAKNETETRTERHDNIYLPEERTEKGGPGISMIMFGNALSNSKAQSSGVSVMKAPTRPKPESIEEISESSYGIPVSFGIGTRIEFTPRWSMSVGVNYTMISRNFRGIYTDNELFRHETAVVNTQSYIGIPVNFYYDIYRGNFVDFYTYAGGTMEKCVSSKYLLKDMQPNTLKETVPGLQWSVNAGLGVEFILTDWLGLYVDPSIRYYFKGSSKSIRTRQQPLTMGFEVGLRVRL